MIIMRVRVFENKCINHDPAYRSYGWWRRGSYNPTHDMLISNIDMIYLISPVALTITNHIF